MITSALLKLIYYVIFALTSPFRLLPDATLSSNLTGAITSASGYISSFTSFLPVGTMLQILGAMLAIEVAVLSYKLIMWVLTKIPGISN